MIRFAFVFLFVSLFASSLFAQNEKDFVPQTGKFPPRSVTIAGFPRDRADTRRDQYINAVYLVHIANTLRS